MSVCLSSCSIIHRLQACLQIDPCVTLFTAHLSPLLLGRCRFNFTNYSWVLIWSFFGNVSRHVSSKSWLRTQQTLWALITQLHWEQNKMLLFFFTHLSIWSTQQQHNHWQKHAYLILSWPASLFSGLCVVDQRLSCIKPAAVCTTVLYFPSSFKEDLMSIKQRLKSCSIKHMNHVFPYCLHPLWSFCPAPSYHNLYIIT